MAIRGRLFSCEFSAWDANTNVRKTGDAANITVYLSLDGAAAVAATNAVSEILLADTTPTGRYRVEITAAEADCNTLTVIAQSSTSNVICEDISFEMEEDEGGPYTVTFTTQTSGAVAVPNVNLYIKNASGVVIQTVATGSNGTVSVNIDDGNFTVIGLKAGYNITTTAFTVSGNTSVTVTCTAAGASPGDSFVNTKYATFKLRLDDWLREEGGDVTDLSKDLLNRAQAELWMYRNWDGLVKRYQLTLSSNAGSMPTDFGGMGLIRVYVDTNGDGKPDKYYYRESDTNQGYKLVNTFAKATGHSWVMTFFSTPPANPYIVYKVLLDDFTGVGDEYSYFPPDLLLATAQKIHIEEADLVGNEYEAILRRQAQLLRDYEQNHQYQNNAPEMNPLDESQQQLESDGFDLQGGSEDLKLDDFDNSYDY